MIGFPQVLHGLVRTDDAYGALGFIVGLRFSIFTGSDGSVVTDSGLSFEKRFCNNFNNLHSPYRIYRSSCLARVINTYHIPI